MVPNTIKSSPALGRQIKNRREKLGMSIEEAAVKSQVSNKTWSRYESGESIRGDKLPHLLRTLRWKELPIDDEDVEKSILDGVDETHAAWSEHLATTYGRKTAACFAVASDLLMDQVKDDLFYLSDQPAGTHLGQIGSSWIAEDLPPQFYIRYDYDFVFALLQTIRSLRHFAKAGRVIQAHTVMGELVLYLIELQIDVLRDEIPGLDEMLLDEIPEGFLGELTDDADFAYFCYSPIALIPASHPYHFDNWLKPQFWIQSIPPALSEFPPAPDFDTIIQRGKKD